MEEPKRKDQIKIYQITRDWVYILMAHQIQYHSVCYKCYLNKFSMSKVAEKQIETLYFNAISTWLCN